MSCTLAEYADYCRLPASFLRSVFNVGDHPLGGIELPYSLTFGDGRPVHRRHRLKPQTDGGEYSKGDGRFTWQNGSHVAHLLYGQQLINGDTNDIVLVEGESDVHVLTYALVPAVGLPGAQIFGHEEQLRWLGRFQRIFVVHEPGDAGNRLIAKVRASPLACKAYAVRLGEHKDPRGMWTSGPETFRQRWDAAVVAATPLWKRDGDEPTAAVVQQAPEFSEEALALTFAREHADDLRHCDGFGRWYLWDRRWVADEKRAVFTMARTLCRAQAERALRIIPKEAAARNEAKRLASRSTVANVVDLARCDARLVASSAFDPDAMLFNTPEGTV
jgi:D5 N terminal like